MSTEVKHSNFHSHSKNASLQTSKMQNLPKEKGDQLLKTLIRKRTQSHENVTESKPPKDSKKKASVSSAQNQDGKKVLKENKCKSSPTKSNMCFCSPTTHEGSFRCRLHRISAAKKLVTEKTSVRCSKFAHAEFKPQLSRFGRVACAEFESHDSLIQLSRLGSS